ncbi:hypothetical protein CLV63_12272 [Murinocardiopsis flavida]|uniref:Uncharacterized protein n=1 Tax=Murinocardiopsis flavida TaxID=645275 RepID=A0A2P8CZX4_9ACTN|nr:hypothetical protein [Murinocardiopsis flavida]PSK90538.1 hypothetical protein CLV63_12272 [Murinocardiopsis flavida]
MAWTWRYEAADGGILDAGQFPDESFTSRGDAESWLGEHWREVQEGGAEKVTLLEEATAVYTMSLAEG